MLKSAPRKLAIKELGRAEVEAAWRKKNKSGSPSTPKHLLGAEALSYQVILEQRSSLDACRHQPNTHTHTAAAGRQAGQLQQSFVFQRAQGIWAQLCCVSKMDYKNAPNPFRIRFAGPRMRGVVTRAKIISRTVEN